MFDPPPGFDDMLSDAEDAPEPSGRFYPLQVKGVGTVQARKPGPAAIPALAMSARRNLPLDVALAYLGLFVQTHTPSGWFEDLLATMIDGDVPHDAVQRCAKAIATAGTARPYNAVLNLSVTAAHHWRMFRARYHSQGIHDPMSIGSMHAILDDVETVAVESAAAGAKTAMAAKAQVSQFYDSLYSSLATEDGERQAAPPGFSEEEQSAAFDAFVKAVK
jgi:hypothetical protein